MKITAQVVDEVILTELGARIARARMDSNFTQAQLARKAGVAKRTLERMEAGGATQLVNLVRVARALGLIERFELLIPEPVPSPLAQLKSRGKERKRVKPTRKAAEPAATYGKWQWGDESRDDEPGGKP